MMQYKGYAGKVQYDADANILHGEVLGIRDAVTFQARSVLVCLYKVYWMNCAGTRSSWRMLWRGKKYQRARPAKSIFLPN